MIKYIKYIVQRIQCFLKREQPMAQKYLEKHFENCDLLCKDILPWQITCVTKISILQHKLLCNILCLNKKLCKSPHHLFALFACLKQKLLFIFLYLKTNILRNKLTRWLGNMLEFPLITPCSMVFIFTEINANRQIINHILLILKYNVYWTRENKKRSLQSSIAHINKLRNTI